MGYFTRAGSGVRGLLGDAAFLDRLARAQAYAQGDPPAAPRPGQPTRTWREEQFTTDPSRIRFLPWQLRAGGGPGRR